MTPTKKSVSGDLEVWDWSLSPDTWGEAQQKDFYSSYFPHLYPKLHFSYTVLGYTDSADKVTVAWRGGSKPDAIRISAQSGPPYVNQGLTAELSPADLGVPLSNFYPQALQTVRKTGASDSDPIYGIPSNNEAMLLIYNKDLFRAAGLDPSHGPATWADLVAYAKAIHDKTGAYGYGLPCVVNNGNTSYRFCPMMWAYGGSLFDELEKTPTWKKVGINSEGTIKALELYNQMYNIDKSAEPSALTDDEDNVETLFADKKCAMMIDHPSAATQAHQVAPSIDIGYDLIPTGPVRRAVVFGGSSLLVRSTTANMDAAIAWLRAFLTPDWNTRLAGLGSEPANSAGYKSAANLLRDQKFGKIGKECNDVSLKMLKYGINVPLVTEGTQVWNLTVPTMIQDVLTKKMSPSAAAANAASQMKSLMTSQ